MFNIKAGLMLLLALILGTGAAYMAYSWIQKQSPVAKEDTGDSVYVYVAAREIPYAQILDETHIKAVVWPRDRVPEGAILATEDLKGKLVNQHLLPGELLMSARISDKLPGSRLSSVVTPSKRAITVRVNDVAGVAGFLLPGNRVDVLATRMENRRAITQTLLQNIKVLAVDQKASAAKDEPIVVRAVTLESDLEQAAQLASATEEGTIQLVLRNPEDQTTQREYLEPVLQAANPQGSGSVRRRVDNRVTIIRGTAVVKTRVRQ